MTTDAVMFVGRSLRSQVHPLSVFPDPPAGPRAIWMGLPVSEAPAGGVTPEFELGYRLTPVLYRAIETQVDELTRAWDRGELAQERAATAGERWGKIIEFAAGERWLEARGEVSRVTRAEADAVELAAAPCSLAELQGQDAAYRDHLEWLKMCRLREIKKRLQEQ